MNNVNSERREGDDEKEQDDYKSVSIPVPFRLPWIIYVGAVLGGSFIFALFVHRFIDIAIPLGALSLVHLFTAIPIGQTLMAVRKGKHTWAIHLRQFAFLRMALKHRKTLPLLHQMIGDFVDATAQFPQGTKLTTETWIVGKHMQKRLIEAGYHVDPVEMDIVVFAKIWGVWWIAQRVMDGRKSAGPFAKNRQVYRLTKIV